MSVYRVHPLSKLHWVNWGDEFVVFCESSGQTHQLDSVRAFVLNFLGADAHSFEAILTELATVPVLADVPQLLELLKTILNEISTHGLVEVTSA